VLSRIDPEDAGVASGVLSTAQQIGGTLTAAVIAVVLVFLLPRRAHPVGSTVVKSNSWKATTSVCQREATNSTCEG
jgi:hypothetical protein